MDPKPEEIEATADRLYRLAHEGHFFHLTLERALTLAGHIPDQTAWRRFLDIALLILGAAFIISGVFFFFAYNWADLASFIKFGLIEASILVATGLAFYLGLDTLSGKAALTGAAMLVGVLLGVFGQVYQTGADAYQLFLGWSILISGWVLISRFSVLWAGWLILLNITLITYWFQVVDDQPAPLYVALALMNIGALLAWELAHHRGVAWLQHRWLPWLIAPVTFIFLLIPTLNFIFSEVRTETIFPLIALLLYIIYTLFTLYFYQKIVPDLFTLTLTALSIIIVLTATAIEVFDIQFDNALVLLVVSLFIIGQTAIAVAWLRRVGDKWEEDHV